MTKTIQTKTLISSALLSVLLLGSLSACAFGVREAAPSPRATSEQDAPDDSSADNSTDDTGNDADNDAGAQPQAPDDALNAGIFTSADCDGNSYTIAQDDSSAVLTGDCGTITISATGVFVSVENAEQIIVTGSRVDVVVSQLAGSVSMGGETNSIAGGSVGSITVPGSSINATLDAATTVAVGGDNNFITWSTGATSAKDTGSGNSVLTP